MEDYSLEEAMPLVRDAVPCGLPYIPAGHAQEDPRDSPCIYLHPYTSLGRHTHVPLEKSMPRVKLKLP